MTLRELIQEQAGEEKGKYAGLFGVARRSIATQLKKTLKEVSGDKNYINQLFKRYVKVLSDSEYDEFAKKNGIKSDSVFYTDFEVEPVVNEVLGDWGNSKEVSFMENDLGKLK